MAARRRCAVAGCPNWARPGAAVCASCQREPKHPRPTPIEPTFAERAHDAEADRRAAAAQEFRRRLANGDYARLFGDDLAQVIAQAAAEASVNHELGALRYVLARLLAEEEDPIALAKAVARVASVSVQAARAQRAISGAVADSLTDAVTQILIELGGEPA